MAFPRQLLLFSETVPHDAYETVEGNPKIFFGTGLLIGLADQVTSTRVQSTESMDYDNHKSVLTSFWIQTTDEELDLPYIYWIPEDAQRSL